MAGCEKDQDKQTTESEVTVMARAEERDSAENGENASGNSGTAQASFQAITLTDVRISVKEGKLLAESTLNVSGEIDLLSELELMLEEPKLVTLKANGKAQTAVIAEGKLRHGTYQGIRLHLEKNTSVSSSDEMYGKSVLIRGEYNGKPFVFWTDAESTVQAGFQEEAVSVEHETELYVYFQPRELFKHIDFSVAADGNANGVIEIGPGGADGNTSLYTEIKAELQAMIKG